MTTMSASPSEGLEVVWEPDPHPGQLAILADRKRYNCVRCGRRFGKTMLAVYLAMEVLIPSAEGVDPRDMKVGYFAPNQDKFLEFWEEMEHRLGPAIASKNKNEKRMRLVNGGTLDCWTLDTDDPGRSRFYKLAVIDEAGLLKNLAILWRRCIRPTLLDRTGAAWFLGSPKAVGRDFNLMFRLGERVHQGQWASFAGKTLDNPHLPPEAKRDVENAKDEMPLDEWLEEYEGIARGSATGFFREDVIERHTEAYATEPVCRGTLTVPLRYHAERDAVISEGRVQRFTWMPDEKGAWRFWFPVKGGVPTARNPRACLGIDIGCGVGSSNSVISAGNSDTGEMWAEYASAGDSPEELARIAAMFGWWIGGKDHPARIHFDATGATGRQFIKALRELDYPNIHIGRVSAVKRRGGPSGEYGLVLNPGTKAALLSEYRSALSTDGIIVPSAASLEECLEYHQDEEKVVHEREMSGSGDDETGARLPHGDRVISTALLAQCMATNPLTEDQKFEPPPGSVAWFEEAAGAEEREEG